VHRGSQFRLPHPVAIETLLGKHERELSDYKLYVTERYASKEYLSETKREILDSNRDLARRIEHS